MFQKFKSLIVILTLVTLTGCKSSPQQDKPIWEKYKITDLTFPETDARGGYKTIETANFCLYTAEVPAENIEDLKVIWQRFRPKDVKFNNLQSFRSNSFRLGRGDIQQWPKLEKRLKEAGADLRNKTSVLIPKNESQNVSIDMLLQEQYVFYVTLNGAMAGATVGPGIIGFKIKNQEIPGSKGLCHMELTPLTAHRIIALIQSEKELQEENEVLFKSAGFEMSIKAGDFLVLGPRKFDTERITLETFFFCREKPEPIVRVYVIICTGVNF